MALLPSPLAPAKYFLYVHLGRNAQRRLAIRKKSSENFLLNKIIFYCNMFDKEDVD